MRSSDQSPSGLTLLTILSLVLFLGALVCSVFDIAYWFKYASWSIVKLSDAFRYYGLREPYFFDWRGIQGLWNYLRDAPLSLLLLVIWFLFTGVTGSLFGSRIQNDRWSNGPHRGKRR
jgi:hypothetical protein